MSVTLQQIERVNQIVLAGVLVLGGCLITFWGAKLFKQIIFLIGFVAGTLFTYFIMNNIDIDPSLRIHLMLSCGVGIFLGFICVLVYKMAVFTTGAIVGLIIAQFVWQFVVSNFANSLPLLMEHAEIYNTVTIIVVSMICGFLAFKLVDIVLRGLTAFIGSFMVTSGVAYFVSKYVAENDANIMNIIDYFDHESNEDIKDLESQCQYQCYISFGIWTALCLSGLIYQYKCWCLCKSKKNSKLSVSLHGAAYPFTESDRHIVINHNHYHPQYEPCT